MTDFNLAGREFDEFFDSLVDGDVSFSESASDKSSSVPDPLGDHGEICLHLLAGEVHLRRVALNRCLLLL